MPRTEKPNKRLSLSSWHTLFGRTPSPNNATNGDQTNGKRSVSTPARPLKDKSAPLPPLPIIINGSDGKLPIPPPKNPPTSVLIQLAQTITRETEKLNRYVEEKSLEQVSFDVDSPLAWTGLDESAKESREEIMRATKELGDLVTGPTERIRWMTWDSNDTLSLRAVYHYKIAKSFPLHETATFTQIAEKVGLDEVNVRRFMRHAMTNRIFREVEPGVVAHTSLSRVLAEDEMMNDWVGFCTEDLAPASSRTIEALELNPAASEPVQTGFCLAEGTTNIEPMFATFGKSPSRAKRFGGGMVSLTGGEGYEVSYLLDNYDWARINSLGGTVVDVGGSHGFVCVDLAKRFANMKFVVQDLPKTIASAPKLDDGIAERITFQAHDFHTEQPIKGADVYLFRWILHNHSDKYAVNMLRQLIPALKKGARVVINDHCLPEPGKEKSWDERIIRTMDLVMLTLLNAREREEGEFKELFAKVDGNFKFLGARRPKGCRMSIVEAVWDGEDYGGVSEVTDFGQVEKVKDEVKAKKVNGEVKSEQPKIEAAKVEPVVAEETKTEA